MTRYCLEIFPQNGPFETQPEDRNRLYAQALETLAAEMRKKSHQDSFNIYDTTGQKIGEAEFIED